MKTKLIILCSILIFSCKNESTTQLDVDTSTITSKELEFKVLDSQYLNADELWEPFEKYWEDFTEEDYTRLKPLILEQDIPTLQSNIAKGVLSYEELTLFYLYRIKKFDRLNELSLNSVIALNPTIVEEAKKADLTKFVVAPHPIFGMPILLKDNINAAGMPTTAGAIALTNNNTDDAFIVKQLKMNGALILGKTNLSEWAYMFCWCPSGYSAVGGQTLNPYNRKVFGTGGSSSGSAVAAATNFAVGTVGSETSGSILSPASQNSVVGLKPTVGSLSRTGIVPISSTLDTPGPLTRNVIDTAILFDAMYGYDSADVLSVASDKIGNFYQSIIEGHEIESKNLRFGVFKKLLKDSLYANAVGILKDNGASIVEIEEVVVKFKGLWTVLSIDMRNDLPKYLKNNADSSLTISNVSDVIVFNKKDSVLTMPYGQNTFYEIVNDKTSDSDLIQIKDSLLSKGKYFFDVHIKAHNLNAILSISNYHSGYAAVAIYPAITVPMGYTNEGQPEGLTFISPEDEDRLFVWAYVYEQLSKERRMPENYN